VSHATRALALVVAACLLVAGCGGVDDGRKYTAEFERAVQIFPGVNVRVLGVDVGRVVEVETVPGGVVVTMRVERDDVQIPEGVQAAVVPASLLGERYIQLFPAYEGGPTLEDGGAIPRTRTAVPSEPDELLRSLQDYLGGLDPETVAAFVSTAAETLEGNGEELNRLIGNASRVMDLLSSKRDDLAEIIVQFDKVTQALASRQQRVGRLINTYNTVAHTLTDNRRALEGTIDGLNEAAIELASLLVAHRLPLGEDIKALTRTSRTVHRNVDALARTGHWAERLFSAASRAIDFDKDWLRLGNQGAPLAALILLRLQQRLMELCSDAGATECSGAAFWQAEVPELFCFAPQLCQAIGGGGGAAARSDSGRSAGSRSAGGAASGGSIGERDQAAALTAALEGIPEVRRELVLRAAEAECVDASNPDACVVRRLEDEDAVQDIVEQLLDDTIGDPMGWAALAL
jgi:phospholipid/cholesterol/gamma-HCH transport system substrate-binding protein